MSLRRQLQEQAVQRRELGDLEPHETSLRGDDFETLLRECSRFMTEADVEKCRAKGEVTFLSVNGVETARRVG